MIVICHINSQYIYIYIYNYIYTLYVYNISCDYFCLTVEFEEQL